WRPLPPAACSSRPPARAGGSSARSSSFALSRSARRSARSRSSSPRSWRTLSPGAHAAVLARRAVWLDLAGEALAAGVDPLRAAQQAVRIAVDATGARGGVMWRLGPDGSVGRLTMHGDVDAALPRAWAIVQESLEA